jgi:hypothetical protein
MIFTAQLALAVIGFRLDLRDRSPQFVVSFSKMRENPISIHGSTILGGSIVVGGFTSPDGIENFYQLVGSALRAA